MLKNKKKLFASIIISITTACLSPAFAMHEQNSAEPNENTHQWYSRASYRYNLRSYFHPNSMDRGESTATPPLAPPPSPAQPDEDDELFLE